MDQAAHKKIVSLQKLAATHRRKVVTHIYGQQINPETYAICKADMLLKGERENADHIVGGAEWLLDGHFTAKGRGMKTEIICLHASPEIAS